MVGKNMVVKIITREQYKAIIKLMSDLKIPCRVSYKRKPEDKILELPQMKFIVEDFYNKN